jgi:hypothetical protein
MMIVYGDATSEQSRKSLFFQTGHLLKLLALGTDGAENVLF